ncbi:MAG: crossover junction endodeoxyribonuclease RuvC [Chlorobiaceae bacterium]|jgi:crossover junction endodeoxyribonuclease RuvC|nr:crossover junction endodeoxyribonuclease RuvC [Chlorobiaceae bacterium]
MVVLGVDPGSLNTGYGVISCDSGAFSMLSCGVIRLHSFRSHAERIGRIYGELEKVIDIFKPERAALETVFLCRNPQSALKLGQVRGAVIALAMNKGLGLHEYAPKEVKLAVTGKGAARKEQVSFMVSRMLGLHEEPRPYDISDALGLALCDLLRSGRTEAVMPQTGLRSKGGGWSTFVREYPHMVIR